MRDIEAFEGLYAVTSCGRVWSYRSQKFLRPGKNIRGYLYVTLCKNGIQKNFLVHRLVAQAFLENPKNLPQVNHKDECKEHNWLGNLEWCNATYNINYGSRNERSGATLSKILVNRPDLSKKVLCHETGVVYPSAKEAERQTGISNGNISSTCNGKRKTAGGFTWSHVVD